MMVNDSASSDSSHCDPTSEGFALCCPQQSSAESYVDQTTGAHFRYEDLCVKLMRLQDREDPENFSQAIDEWEMEAKVKSGRRPEVQRLVKASEVGTHFTPKRAQKTDMKLSVYLSTGCYGSGNGNASYSKAQEQAGGGLMQSAAKNYMSQKHIAQKSTQHEPALLSTKDPAAKPTEGWRSNVQPAAAETFSGAVQPPAANLLTTVVVKTKEPSKAPAAKRQGKGFSSTFQRIATANKPLKGLSSMLHGIPSKDTITTANMKSDSKRAKLEGQTNRLLPMLGSTLRKGRFSVSGSFLGTTMKRPQEARSRAPVPRQKSRQFMGLSKALSGCAGVKK